MEDLLSQGGLKITPKKLNLLWSYHQLLRKRDDELDLTRLKNFEAMVVKHYVDCLYIRTLCSLPSPLLDIGTGPGLPGIPIKIFTPSLEIILAEKRQKRVQFLEEVARELDLEVQIYPHSVNRTFPIPVEGVITRAVETMDKTLKRVQDFLKPGGKVIFMKGPSCEEEIRKATEDLGSLYQVKEEIEYTLPNTSHHRKLVIFERL